MTEITIQKNDAGQRADRFLSKAYPNLKSALVNKLMRKKRIKLNGARVEPNVILKEGDVFRFYLSDELLSKKPLERANDFRDISAEINVIYEDENILLCDKPCGLVVHEDNENSADTLINRILSYLYQKGEFVPEDENSFTPALVNRIDRNTSGIVIAAKNAEALRILNQKLRDRELEKLVSLRGFRCSEAERGGFDSVSEEDFRGKSRSHFRQAAAGFSHNQDEIPRP